MLIRQTMYPIFAALCMLFAAAHANANLLTNPSFESGAFVNQGNVTMVLPVGSTAITGWTVVADQLAWIDAGNPWGLSAQDGTRFLDLTAYQTGAPFGLLPGVVHDTLGWTAGINHRNGGRFEPDICGQHHEYAVHMDAVFDDIHRELGEHADHTGRVGRVSVYRSGQCECGLCRRPDCSRARGGRVGDFSAGVTRPRGPPALEPKLIRTDVAVSPRRVRAGTDRRDAREHVATRCRSRTGPAGYSRRRGRSASDTGLRKTVRQADRGGACIMCSENTRPFKPRKGRIAGFGRVVADSYKGMSALARSVPASRLASGLAATRDGTRGLRSSVPTVGAARFPPAIV
jgi:hypothetical protein